MKTIDIDKGYKKLYRQLNILKNKPYVKVGLLEKAGVHIQSDLTVAQIGIIHEFGLPKARIPQRSFMRTSFDENKEKWLKITKGLKRRIEQGQLTVAKALDIIGLMIKRDITHKIVMGPFAPLSQRRIEEKGSSVPLIDTTQMINSIDYVKIMKKLGF